MAKLITKIVGSGRWAVNSKKATSLPRAIFFSLLTARRGPGIGRLQMLLLKSHCVSDLKTN